MMRLIKHFNNLGLIKFDSSGFATVQIFGKYNQFPKNKKAASISEAALKIEIRFYCFTEAAAFLWSDKNFSKPISVKG